MAKKSQSSYENDKDLKIIEDVILGKTIRLSTSASIFDFKERYKNVQDQWIAIDEKYLPECPRFMVPITHPIAKIVHRM